MLKMITIRPVIQSDLQQIMQIEWESFSEPYSLNVFELLAKTVPELFLVAVETEVIVGYIIAEIDQSQGYYSGHLISLAVRKRMRREGIGHQLLSNLIDILRERNCKEVTLEVRISNNSAKSFYRTQHFHEVNYIHDYYEDGEDAILMKRVLEEPL
jgi:ribosomal-protein-alanine N-acetyltransferase